MRRRSRFAAALIALLVVGTNLVGTEPSTAVRAADPIAEAKARQEQIRRTLREQEAQLVRLSNAASQLTESLATAEAELSELTAEYYRIYGLLEQVKVQIADIRERIAELREHIAKLDGELRVTAAEIAQQSVELAAREVLLEDHLRSAYEQSQTSILEMLLSADSLEAASNHVGYLLTMSDQDKELAEEIRLLREGLRERRAMLAEGRRSLTMARRTAEAEHAALEEREAELAAMEIRLAELKEAAEIKRAEQEAMLNQTLELQGSVSLAYEQNTAAADAQDLLVQQLIAQEAERQRLLEEARRRQAAEAEARRRAAADAARFAAQQRSFLDQPPAVSMSGFAWPETRYTITQEFGPTSFALEPPYTYDGQYYRHFHTGIDMANGCGTPVMAAKEGVVIASGRPLAPFDSGFGVIIDHGENVHTWYWHLQSLVIVRPGQIVTQGQLIGYEGNTGFSTGCHLHFAVNVDGRFENPRFFLP